MIPPRDELWDMRSGTAVVLVDGCGNPIYYNCEAVAVLMYSRRRKSVENVADFLPRSVQSLLLGPQTADNTPRIVEFTSGRRCYICRGFTLTSRPGMRSGTMTVLLLERETGKAANLSEMAGRFHLSRREQEMVGLLTLGLTSKEIAVRMKISPNTVKTFFRLVMTKMGVSTRTAIVGKIASMNSPVPPHYLSATPRHGATPFGR